jgi:general secretion pathway protein H
MVESSQAQLKARMQGAHAARNSEEGGGAHLPRDSRFAICDLRPSGFSLIEILVVTVILAITAVAVTLAVSGAGGERQLARDAERLQALIGYACEQAELSGRQIGLSLDHDGYRFSRSDHADWVPERDGELRPRKWSVKADALLTRDGQHVDIGVDFPEKPQLVCFSSGELTAFRLELALPDSTTRYRVDGRPAGDVVASIIDGPAR